MARLNRTDFDGDSTVWRVMAEHSTHSTQGRYPPELRERAVRLVAETASERGDRHGAVILVARQQGIGPESVRQWVRQAEINRGERSGLTSVSARSTTRRRSTSSGRTTRHDAGTLRYVGATSRTRSTTRRGRGKHESVERRSGRGERRQATLRHLNVPVPLRLEIALTGAERSIGGATA